MIKTKYGLTPEAVDRMVTEQSGRCAICKAAFVDVAADRFRWSPFAIDHCHKTGKVRGLLCHKCNKGLGLFADDRIRLRAAIGYLEGSDVE